MISIRKATLFVEVDFLRLRLDLFYTQKHGTTTVQENIFVSKGHFVSLFSAVTLKATFSAFQRKFKPPHVPAVVARVCCCFSENIQSAAARPLCSPAHAQQGDRQIPPSLHSAAAASQAPLSLLLLLHRAAQAHLPPLCALLFALCLNCRRALKNIIPHRGNVGQVGPSRDPEQG